MMCKYNHENKKNFSSTEVNRKKVQIILVILGFSLVGAFILTLVNVSQDLQVSQFWVPEEISSLMVKISCNT